MVRAMTTLKPQLVRADTLDLQAHDAPSAKDHSRQPAHASPYGYGPAAPHQAQTLRHAEQRAYQQQHPSPRSSEEGVNGGLRSDQHFYDDLDDEGDDDHTNAQDGVNGNVFHGQDLDDGEGGDSHDEDMDDDLLDKISSSPSIDDGNYPLPLRPPRADSVDSGASPASLSTPNRGTLSSSPFSSTPEYFPLCPSQVLYPASHHGEHTDIGSYSPVHPRGGPFEHAGSHDYSVSALAPVQSTHLGDIPSSESQEFRRYLLPLDDPLWPDTVDGHEESIGCEEDDVWEDEESSLQDPYLSSDDDTDDFHFSLDDRFTDSGWGGECLRDVEDIDFEFVYALHTFVATVEGQANATKGDTMVLLDDSNSYWWLVRVVKDASIGYLPAEHIETPTERLARLNKHRNVDLSASMLADSTEKSKNPLKKAMRRRNAKTVQFTAPTYYEPSEYDYSDEDEEEGEDETLDQLEDQDEVDSSEDQEEATGTTAEHLDQSDDIATSGIQRLKSNDSLRNEPASPVKAQQSYGGLEQQQTEEPFQRSRKGVVRNTDSFFKDDTVETKKISLTPRLLRGDSESGSANEQELRQRPSLETFDKTVGLDDRSKKKEKKGMLSGLFKRKKGATHEEVEKVQEDSRQSPQSKDSLESLSSRPEIGPERKPSKLQKTPPTISPKPSPTESRAPQRDVSGVQSSTTPPAPTGPAPAPPTVRTVEDDAPLEQETPVSATTQSEPAAQVNRFPSLTEKRSIFSPITTALKSTPSAGPNGEPPIKTIYSKRAKERFALDDSESEDLDDIVTADEPGQDQSSVSPITEPEAPPPRSESGTEASSIESTGKFSSDRYPGQPPAAGSSSPLPRDNTPADSEGSMSTSKPSPSTAVHTPSTSRSTPTWSDASLRMYMDNDQDIKDLLVIVHDKSNVTPIGPDHPLMHDLFSQERTKLAEMQSQLDSMLMHWISKKNSNLLAPAN